MNNYNQIAQAATNAGNALSNSFERQYDRSAIDEILEQANLSGSEDALDNAIGQILQRVSPQRQPQAIAVLQQKKARISKENERKNEKARLTSLGLPENLAGAEASTINQVLKNNQEDPRITVQNMKNQSAQTRYNQIVGNQGQPNQSNTQVQPPFLPGMQPSSMGKIVPQENNQQQSLHDLSDDQLIQLTGVPGYSEPAKQELKRRQEERNLNQDIKKTQSKEVIESYKINNDFINKTIDQYEDSLRKEAIIDKMNDLAPEVSESGIINLLEMLGLKSEWLKNPANEEYTKLSLDLLGGGSLQADYGSRVLGSEFKVSLQRIPTLSQTPEGRKQISENLKAMLLPARLKQERLQYYLDESEKTGKPLPHNLKSKIIKDIQPQLKEAYDKFKQRNGRYKVEKGTYPDDNSIEKYYFMANENIDKAKQMMKEDGYDITPKSKRGISTGSARSR